MSVMDPMRRPKGLDYPFVPPFLRAYSRAHVWLYRRTGGRVGGKWRFFAAFPRGVPILLLTTIGRKSGQPKTTPLLFLEDGNRVIVVGSQGGLPRNPQWFLNILANPKVEVEIGRTKRALQARQATPEEHAVLWPRLLDLYADFATYQSWTDRRIPVVILE